MSTILLRDITIADPHSQHNGKTTNVLLEGGTVLSIGTENFTADEDIQCAGYFISPGWTDTLAFCGEPGEEWKETIASLAETGSAGGFTRIAAMCGVHPLPDSAASVHSVKQKGKNVQAEILPIGAITLGCEGKEMAEIFDMQSAGAVAFFDGDHALSQNGIKSRVLDYANNCQAPVYLYPCDASLSEGGSMHEGIESTKLGLKGIPSISEISALQSDISLGKWLNVPLHVVRISCAKSVELIRQAKLEGLQIFASVPVMNLLFTDKDLAEFNENFKVLPPLRTELDRIALISGVLDGTIDAVCSNHVPQDSESKDVEFDYSANGAATIQSVFSGILEATKTQDPTFVAELLAYRSAKMLNLPVSPIEVNHSGSYTLFTLKNSSIFINSTSKSRNNPFEGKSMVGSILGTIHDGKFQTQLQSGGSNNR